MKVSFFIDRPVFSAVISIVIVIVGIIGLTMLPVDQYPQITPPVVKISASYPAPLSSVAYTIFMSVNGLDLGVCPPFRYWFAAGKTGSGPSFPGGPAICRRTWFCP